MRKSLQSQELDIIAWDGEGENINDSHRLILLANSKGDLLLDKERKGKLTYQNWLPFITQYQKAVNVWYSFQYDVNMMFKDLPVEQKIQLFQEQKKTEIDGYIVKYIPRKILTIHKNKSTFTHYDVFGFFQTSFLKTLESWKITIPEIIQQGKVLRSDFTKQKLDFIINYNFAECEKLSEVVTKLKQYMQTAGIPPLRSWHGAGAIASRFLKDWNFEFNKTNLVPNTKLQSLFDARKYSYFGGHSELFMRGLINKKIHQYDINSAYPNACRFIPSLHDKTWTHLPQNKIKNLEPTDFALVHAKWNLDYDTRVGPLPFRLNDNTIIFPRKGEGWYHYVEVLAALKRGYKIQMIEAWVLDKPYIFFLKDHIEHMAKIRLELKRKKDLGNIPIKLGLNALYGKIAQKPIPRENGSYRYGNYTDLFLAGYITAHTRAQILQHINLKSTIMIATDGIFSIDQIDVPIGNNLGEWEYTEHLNGNFLMSGIYALQHQDKEWVLKTRGYTNMNYPDFQKIYKKQIAQEEVKFPERRFMSIRLALRAPKYRQCEFEPVERYINWNNNKKRIFKFPEADFSDSITVDQPHNQSFSKMYNPYTKAIDMIDEPNLNLMESIPIEEI